MILSPVPVLTVVFKFCLCSIFILHSDFWHNSCHRAEQWNVSMEPLPVSGITLDARRILFVLLAANRAFPY